MRFGGETITRIPADAVLRPLRDQIVLEPLDVEYSSTIVVVNETKPLRGRILAIGPGHYPMVYLDSEGDRLPDHRRAKRSAVTYSKHFQPTTCKVGDVVELGGLNIHGYSFETFIWGDKTCIHCREADVAGVHTAGMDQGPAAGPAKVLGRHVQGTAARGQGKRRGEQRA